MAAQPVAAKKCRLTCGLCASTCSVKAGDGLGGTAEFFLCEGCDNFVAESGYEVKELQSMKSKKGKQFETVKAEQEEWQTNMNEPEAISYPREEVYEEVRQVSELVEQFHFVSREKFRGLHGCYPDEARVNQVRALNRKNEEVVGVAVLIDDNDPVLKVSTARAIVHRRPVLEASRHLYSTQAGQVYNNKAAQAATTLGQRWGNKYQPKLKAVDTYTHEELKQLVQKSARKSSRGRPSAVHGMVTGKAGEEENNEGDDESSDDGQGGVDLKPGGLTGHALPAGQANMASPPALQSRGRSIEASARSSPRAASGSSAGGSAGVEGRSPEASQQQEARSRTPPRAGAPLASPSDKGTRPVPKIRKAASVISSSFMGEPESRLKPPQYWFDLLTPSKVWSGASVKRQIQWARDCIKRTATAGDSITAKRLVDHVDNIEDCDLLFSLLMDPSKASDDCRPVLQRLVKSQVDFDSVVQLKLLGKRLASQIASMVEADEQQLEELVATLNPFMAKEEDCSSDEEGPCRAVQEVPNTMYADSVAFDPLEPVLSSIDGTEASKVPMMLKVLMNDVVPSIIKAGEAGLPIASSVSKSLVDRIEEGITEMDTVPGEASSALSVCRVLHAMADSTIVDMDFDTLELFFGQCSKKAKGPLCDLGILLNLDEQVYKKRFNGLEQCFADAKVYLPQVQKELDKMSHIANPSSIDSIDIFLGACEVVLATRAALRQGAAYALESACHNFLAKLIGGMTVGNQKHIIPATWSPELVAKMVVALQKGVDIWKVEAYSLALTELQQEEASRTNEARSQKLYEMAVSSLNRNTASIDQGKFSEMVAFMNAVSGFSIGTDTSHKWCALLAELRAAIASGFPMGKSMAVDLLRISELVQGDALASHIAVLRSIAAGSDLDEAYRSHLALGGDIGARVAADGEKKAAIQAIMVMANRVQEALNQVEANDLPEAVVKLREDATKYMQDIANASVEPVASRLASSIDECKGWAAGGKDGEPWHDPLAEQAPLDEVIAHAKGTLLKQAPEVYEKMWVDLKKEVAAYSELCSFFSATADSTLESEAGAAMKKLALCFVEGLLVALFDSKHPKEALKQKLHAIKRKSKPMKVEWTNVHSSLVDRAARAAKLQS